MRTRKVAIEMARVLGHIYSTCRNKKKAKAVHVGKVKQFLLGIN